jgi:DinB superfamily
MPIANPYASDLGSREPLDALAETPGRIHQLVERWGEDHFERTYAPGKWTARKILVHLAPTELALGTRVRFALSQEGYSAQPFSQDDWIPLDERVDARTALETYVTVRRLNLAMFRTLTPDQQNRSFNHPEYGELTVGWVMAQMAGHDIHHLKQLEQVR